MNPLINILPFILIFFVMYFFMMRPQMQKQKQQTAFQNSLEKGMDIVTSGGILGRIVKVEDDIITLQVDNKSFIKIHKSAVSKEMTDGVKFPAQYLNA